MSDLRSQTPTETLDVQGRACPYPIVLVKQVMEKLPGGSILKVLCDSPETAEDSIPRYCEKRGYQFEAVKIEEDYWELFIQKG
ncbi:MAG: sulfurtransferase TusA family protein [Nitrospirota bacterium]